MFSIFRNKKIARNPFIPYAIADIDNEFVIIEKNMANGRSKIESPPLESWTSQDQDAAKAAVYFVGPHVYTLKIAETIKTANILIFGCQGSGSEAQKRVADLMKEISNEVDPLFMLGLGDNLYDYGARSPADRGFDERFYSIYPISKPALILLGNHDANYHAKRMMDFSYDKRKMNPSGAEAEINEVAHTYLAHKSNNLEESIKIFQNDKIELNNLSRWNMPYFFYSLIIGDTQIFFINSNSYPKDYLEFQKGNIKKDEFNQAQWLADEYIKAKTSGKKIIFAQHHPLFTCGKRIFKSDCKHYLYQEDINELNVLLESKTESYNTILSLIYQRQGFMPDLILAAHDHFTSYYNNNIDDSTSHKTRQATFGNGGGKLQSCESFSQHMYMGCHLESYGFGMLNFSIKNPEELLIDFFTLCDRNILTTNKYLQLKFSNKDHFPIQEIFGDDYLTTFQKKILLKCKEFFAQFKELEQQRINQTPKSGLNLYTLFSGAIKYFTYLSFWTKEEAEAIKIVHEIQAYLNQKYLPDIETLKRDLCMRIIDIKPGTKICVAFDEICSLILNIDLSSIETACQYLEVDFENKLSII